MKNLLLLAFASIGFVSTAHADGCLYLVEAHVMSKKITFLSDLIELPYPPGSQRCSYDSAGKYIRRQSKLEEQFISFIKTRNPGLDISNIDVHAKWYTNENEAKLIQQITNTLVASGKTDARGNRVMLLSGRFYSE